MTTYSDRAPTQPNPQALDRGETSGINLIRSVNPVSRLLAMLVLTTPLLVSVDLVSASVALGFTLLLSPLCGVGWGSLLKRAWPILLVTPISGISMALYGRPEGKEYFSFWWAHVTENSVSLAIAIMVRVLAIALPVIVLSTDVDPTDLGDGLAQVFHLPARFVIGAVAGVRLATLFTRDWQAMSRSRRSRGLADDGKIARGVTMVFGLLVLAIRRGAKLSTAMEARAFGAPGKRSWARPSTVGIRDLLLVLICAGVAAVALSAAIATGYLRFLGA